MSIHNTPDEHPTHRDATGPETWVREAIAEQEEYLKRRRSCAEVRFRSHQYRTVEATRPDGTAVSYEACAVCDVTRTAEDYRVRLSLDI